MFETVGFSIIVVVVIIVVSSRLRNSSAAFLRTFCWRGYRGSGAGGERQQILLL